MFVSFLTYLCLQFVLKMMRKIEFRFTWSVMGIVERFNLIGKF